MATATRSPSTYKGVAFNADQLLAQKVQDLIFGPAPVLHVMNRVCRETKQLGKNITIPWMDTRAGGFTPFDDYDTLVPVSNQGPHAGLVTRVHYAMPLMKSWTSEMDEGTGAQLDRAGFDLDQLLMTFRDELDRDMHLGQDTDSRRILGLEQWLKATDNDSVGTATDAYTRLTAPWQAKQSANVIAGITRVAHTATTGGTGFEHVSINAHDWIGDATAHIGYSSGVPNDGMKAFLDTYNFCQVGLSAPNVCFMSRGYYGDLQLAGMEKTFLQRDVARIGDIDLGLANIKFNGCSVIMDDRAATQGATVAGGAKNGYERYYFLNTSTWKFVVDPRADFKLLSPRPSKDSLAAVRWLVLRCGFYCINPRFNGTGYADN